MDADFDGELRKLTAALQNRVGAGSAVPDSIGRGSSLAAKVKHAASNYCTREEAMRSLAHVYAMIRGHRFKGDIAELYTTHARESEGEPPDAAAIGRWLDKLQGHHGYFATPRRTTERRRRYGADATYPALTAGTPTPAANRRLDYIDVDQDVVRGFSLTADIPLNYLLVRLSPRYASVAPAECYVVALLSRTHLRLFWGFSHFRYLDWERAVRVGSVEWATDEVLLRDIPALEQVAEYVCNRFADFVEEQLRAEYGSPPVVANAAE